MATLKKDIVGAFRKVYGKAGDPVTIIKDYGNSLAVEDITGDKWFVAAALVNMDEDEMKIYNKDQSADASIEPSTPELDIPARSPTRTQKPVKGNPSQSSLF